MRGVRGGADPTRGCGKDVRGFTLVALLLALVILSIALALARPFLHRGRIEARATQVVEDLNQVREAVLAYRSDQGAWPEEGRRGQVPPELAEYLPEEFSFQTPHYVLDLESWAMDGSGAFEVGVSFFTDDPELGSIVLGMFGTQVWTDGQAKYTWVIED